MKRYTISTLGKKFGLSRSTLLYYDRIDLLSPGGRSPSGYRIYTDLHAERLERICHFRNAGLTLKQIKALLSTSNTPSVAVIETQLKAVHEQIQLLKIKVMMLGNMLKEIQSDDGPKAVDKTIWVEMLKAAGMEDRAMATWHAEFERRAPDSHHQFLAMLDIPEGDIVQIRQRARQMITTYPAEASLAGDHGE